MPNQTQASIIVASTCWLIEMQGWCSSWSSPDKDELVVWLLEAEAEEGAGDLLPVDVVQEDVPLVQRPVGLGNEFLIENYFLLGFDFMKQGSLVPEGRVHVLP